MRFSHLEGWGLVVGGWGLGVSIFKYIKGMRGGRFGGFVVVGVRRET